MGQEGRPKVQTGRRIARGPRLLSLRVVVAFLVFSLIWVIGGDMLVRALFGSSAAHGLVQTLKGVLYVLVAATLLYFAIRHAIDSSARLET